MLLKYIRLGLIHSINLPERLLCGKDILKQARAHHSLPQEKFGKDVLNAELSGKRRKSLPFCSDKENKQFMNTYSEIIQTITNSALMIDGNPEIINWYTKVIDYNVPHGKKLRGLSVLNMYKALTESDSLTSDNLKLAYILGWCVEYLQGFGLLIDDIIDKSEFRRSAPCWYKYAGRGLSAFKDGVVIEHSIYTILKTYFSNHPKYKNMLELFSDITLKTFLGQVIELVPAKDLNSHVNRFSMETYKNLVKYKTSYYTCLMPAILATYLAGPDYSILFKQIKDISFKLGLLFQINNDFSDCFGDAKHNGKELYSDIKEGRPTWLVVKAFEFATSEQRKILEDSYGVDKPDAVQRILKLYELLELPKIFFDNMEKELKNIKLQIERTPNAEFLKHHGIFIQLEDLIRREY